MAKPAKPTLRTAGAPSTRVLALRLSEVEIVALERFGRTIGVSAGQVLKVAGQALADGKVAIGAEEAGFSRAVAHELSLVRIAVERLEAGLERSSIVKLAELDNAFAKLLAALAAFEASANSFADRRQAALRAIVFTSVQESAKRESVAS